MKQLLIEKRNKFESILNFEDYFSVAGNNFLLLKGNKAVVAEPIQLADSRLSALFYSFAIPAEPGFINKLLEFFPFSNQYSFGMQEIEFEGETFIKFQGIEHFIRTSEPKFSVKELREIRFNPEDYFNGNIAHYIARQETSSEGLEKMKQQAISFVYSACIQKELFVIEQMRLIKAGDYDVAIANISAFKKRLSEPNMIYKNKVQALGYPESYILNC